MKKLTIKLTPPLEDQALRSGDFFLMPEAPVPPAIVSDLDKNIRQKTWISEYINGEPSYLEIEPIFGRFTVLAGTAIEMFVIAEDPSLVDPDLRGDDSRLKYAWKRNGATIVEVNALNNGKGISGLALESREVNENVAGIYTCEVSNAYGTTVSNEIELVVVDPKNHPKLFKNLLKNGSSTIDWTVTEDVITRTFIDSVPATNNFGSLPHFCYFDFGEGIQKVQPGTPDDFRFSQAGHSGLLFSVLNAWKQKDPNLYDISPSAKQTHNESLPDWLAWMSRSYPAQIVPNEDLETYKFAAFFPGLKWMDLYNRNLNGNLIGLTSETANHILTYITRDKIKFKKDGGNETSTASQIIDLQDVDAVVDGKVLGMRSLQAQFFAYVGAGITGYQIKATTENGVETFNWFVNSSFDISDRLQSNKDNRVELVKDSVIEIIPLMQDSTTISLIMRNANGVEIERQDIEGPDAKDVFAIKEKSFLPITWYPIFDQLITNNNTIKIFGQKYSDTNALLNIMSPNPDIPSQRLVGYNYRLRLNNFSGGSNKRRKFKNVFNDYGYSDDFGEQIIGGNGSWDIDGWFNKLSAPTRLLSIPLQSEDLSGESTETISAEDLKQIQKREAYRRMKRQLEDIDGEIKITLSSTPIYQNIRVDNDIARIHTVDVGDMDRNAAFFIKKVPFKEGGRYYPKPAPPNYNTIENSVISDKRTFKALEDFGAAAMFGVGATVNIPKNTRSVEVLITFSHTSDAIEDSQPESKGWTKPEIYRNDYTTAVADSSNRPTLEYGYPRCGVTLAKVQLMPAGSGASDKFVSYYIPPAEFTVLGLRRRRLFEDVNDTSQPGTFEYDYQMPKSIPQMPAIDIFSLDKATYDYAKGVRTRSTELDPRPSQEELNVFERDVVGTEDASKDRIELIEGVVTLDDEIKNTTLPEDTQPEAPETAS
jgi:hypothetical protein